MIRVLLVILAVISTGCQYDPYTAVYTTKQPRTNDLFGVYTADTNTIDLFVSDGHYRPVSPSITLFPDGAIVITNIPDWWNTFGQARGGFDSGRGFWRVEKHQDWWAVLGWFTNTTQFASLTNKSERFGPDMMLIGEKPPYKIHLIIGDPDEGKGMEFEKSAEAR